MGKQNVRNYPTSPKQLFKYLSEKYGPVCLVHLGPMPTVVISDEKYCKLTELPTKYKLFC